MREVFQKVYSDELWQRAYQWSKLFTLTGVAQLLVQAIGFISGIVVIRMLPTNEYSMYVLANTTVGTMVVLADSGISTGVTSEGGQVWKDKKQLGQVLSTGLALRKHFGAVSLLVATPCAIVLLQSHGASTLSIVLTLIAIAFTFLSTLSNSLLQVPAKLQQDIAALQKNQVTLNFLRLGVSLLTLAFFPFAFVAIIASGLPQLWSNLNLRRFTSRYVDWHQPSNSEVRERIIEFVKRLMPGSVYFCISGQLSIWLISVYGSTSSIAHVGALSRLAAILSLLSVLLNTLVVPRFARLNGSKTLLYKHYLSIQAFMVLSCGIFVFSTWLFSNQILWILGEAYTDLTTELVLCVTGSCLNVIVGINYILNSSRGWLLNPIFSIAIGVIGIVLGVLLVDVSTIKGVLLFNIFTGIVGLFVHPLYGFRKIASLKNLKSA